ncbi:MAG: heat-inducible transcriptional repressor HrcA, partial [Oceanococcus sp.]
MSKTAKPNEGANAEAADLSERACRVLKLVVERFIVHGQPIASRALSQTAELNVSPATIRNTLSELEQLGFLEAPHTSSGRVPTAKGYRYFVDALLSPQTPEIGEFHSLQHQLLARMNAGEEAASSASHLLSQLSQMAAVVSVPRQNHCILKQIQFVALTSHK